MIASLPLLIQAVKAGLTGWKQIKAALQSSKLTVQDELGQDMTLAELEPHILAAENARDAAAAHAHDRIENRHRDN